MTYLTKLADLLARRLPHHLIELLAAIALGLSLVALYDAWRTFP